MDWIYLSWDMDKQPFINMAMNLQVPQSAGNFSIS